MYAYAANNPIKYTDPDGRIFGLLMVYDIQNNSFNSPLSMGATASGVFNENNELIKQNTIGSYGCLFVSTMNVGNSVIFNSMGPKQVKDFSASDRYFYYSQPQKKGNAGWTETDALMNSSHMKNLLYDLTGHMYSITSYSGKEYVSSMIQIFQKAKEKVYGIAEVKTIYGSHFINLYWNESTNKLSYFDPYKWENNEIIKAIDKQVQDRNFRLIIIREKGDEIVK